ncbi:MAG TPA: chorismate-binding protein, partial [Puia sp.]|nr:chorismate-binding protein [Puia sp.]
PFGGYYKLGDVQLLCASPERYLSRRGRRLLSQPIKGTWARDLQNSRQDELYKSALFNNAKERAENVMIVDLVRNDLSRVCVAGSVKVEELFGIYTFPQVHQMISAVVGEPETGRTWVDMVRSGFPMGSMTGAPKRRVLQLIETYERNRRGLFSGAIGYVTPERDFDFNVVIRSILYNANLHQLSFSVGSGITFYSQAGQEYEECMLKAAAIKKVLTG